MAPVTYYRDGRGIVEILDPTAEQFKESLRTAAALVCEEAVEHRHWGTPWTVSNRTAITQCSGCGQTAVITRLAHCLVVDSYLHNPCTPGARSSRHFGR
jgi:hypothetical protein